MVRLNWLKADLHVHTVLSPCLLYTSAMEEGYSTASEEIREMGFGAGMGLPNMKRCADELVINTNANEGTRVEITIYLLTSEG